MRNRLNRAAPLLRGGPAPCRRAALQALADEGLIDQTKVSEAIHRAGLTTVGLLGTRFTMEQDFYRVRLTERHGLQVIVPDAADRETVHWVIYEELCLGQVREDSRSHYRRIIQRGVASPRGRTQ